MPEDIPDVRVADKLRPGEFVSFALEIDRLGR
jgi:hypothetical protein